MICPCKLTSRSICKRNIVEWLNSTLKVARNEQRKGKKHPSPVETVFRRCFRGILALVYVFFPHITSVYRLSLPCWPPQYDENNKNNAESNNHHCNIARNTNIHSCTVVNIHFSSSNDDLMFAYYVHFRLIISSWINILLYISLPSAIFLSSSSLSFFMVFDYFRTNFGVCLSMCMYKAVW